MEKYKNKGLLREIWDYLKIRKKWWIVPIIVLLLFTGFIIVTGGSGAWSPLFYALG